MIRKKAKAKAEVVFQLNELPENKVSTEFMPKEMLCHYLMLTANKRKMAETFASRYKTNTRLKNDFSYEELHGELSITITQVLNAWTCYWAKKKKRPLTLPESAIVNLAPTTRLNTFGDITGYFVNAYKNNISKKYNKYKTYKRAAPKALIYLDSAEDEHVKNTYEGLIADNPHQQLEYEQAMAFLQTHLTEFDAEENEKQRQLYAPDEVPMKKQSHLAKLFGALLDQQYQGNMDLIRVHFNWTDYIFKRNKEVLMKKLKTQFPDLGRTLLQFVVEDRAELAGETKKEEQEKAMPKTLEIHKVFGMTNEGNKQRFTLTTSIDTMEKGRWIPLKTIKQRELVVKKNSLSFTEAKAKLQAQSTADAVEAQQLLVKLKAQA